MPAFWTILLLTCAIPVFGVQGYGITDEVLDRYAEVKRNSFEIFEEESVTPVEIDDDGQPVVKLHGRSKRDVEDIKTRKHFAFRGFGEQFLLDLEPEDNLLAPGFKVYHRRGRARPGVEEEKVDLAKCLFRGKLKHRPYSAVALNLCGGMSGLLKTETTEYLIEPQSRNNTDSMALEKPHKLTKRSTKRPQQQKSERNGQNFFCGKKRRYMPHKPRRKDHWLPDEFADNRGTSSGIRVKRWADRETNTRGRNSAADDKRRQRRNRRSVETLVVADREMVKKHGTENVTNYLLTVFNMVSMLYQDSTIGSNVSVILVGIVLLEGDEPGLTLSHNAENSLSSFCQWQSTIHTSRGGQHDHAVLVTGLDICSWKNEPCDTLGYAPISGMCSKYRSCTVNEDSGLALAFTVAHEIGHNFGMIHDGQGSSPCRRKRGTIMSATLSGLDSSLLWSECSRRDLAKFLESPRSLCLKNVPDFPGELQFPDSLPGQMYDADMQCRLQFGTKSKLCEHYPRKNEVCRALWCQRNGWECETKFLPAAEGTPCGKNKWCRKGACMDRELEKLQAIDGGWSAFSPWSNCSRPCGGGLMVRERACDSPLPSNGGSYCKGEENEYQICGTQECKSDSLEYHNDQCATFNKRTVKGKFYRWKPYGRDLGALSRCRIYCVPDKEDLYLVLSTKLQDGTSCNGNYSGVCIDGECRNVGCDGKIDSSITPDMCGVCNGDNSTCKTIKGSFNTSHLARGYEEVIRIPPNSRQIHISERQEYPTYLAIRDDKRNYYLNANWTLEWPGRYNAAGTTFSYRRWQGQPENLIAKGPITEEIVIEVLIHQPIEAIIDYQFVISATQGHWEMQNSTCSVTCGNGTFSSSPVCVSFTGKVVNDIYCDQLVKPSIKKNSCIEKTCFARWHIGAWLFCNNGTCKTSQQAREVFCISEGKKVPSFHCDGQKRPEDTRQCNRNECLYVWHTGPWLKCRGPCKNEFQTRSVTCRTIDRKTAESFSNCDNNKQPIHKRKCTSTKCTFDQEPFSSMWVTGPWGKCNVSCGKGEETRNVTCIKKSDDIVYPSSTCSQYSKPHTTQSCTGTSCNIQRITECTDFYEWCPTSTNEKLCKLKFYLENCCQSCQRKT